MTYVRMFWDISPKEEWPHRCIRQIGTWQFRQCSRKRGHGPDGLFCKQHAGIVTRMLARMERMKRRGV